MHWDTFNQDNYSTVGGNRGCRVAGYDHKGFQVQQLSEITHYICK